MSTKTLTLFIVIIASTVIFLLTKPKQPIFADAGKDDVKNGPQRRYIAAPTFNPDDVQGNEMAENALQVLQAYIKAWNAGETDNDLIELNTILLNKYGLKVINKDVALHVVNGNNDIVLINKV